MGYTGIRKIAVSILLIDDQITTGFWGQTPSNLSTIEPLGTADALGSVARWRGAFPVGPEDQ